MLPSAWNCSGCPVSALLSHVRAEWIQGCFMLPNRVGKKTQLERCLFNAFLGTLKLLTTEPPPLAADSSHPAICFFSLFICSNHEFCFQRSRSNLIHIHCPSKVWPRCFLPLACYLPSALPLLFCSFPALGCVNLIFESLHWLHFIYYTKARLLSWCTEA